MLVYLKSPMSYSFIDGKRIYGKKFAYGSFGPSNISYDLYLKNKDRLEEAEYTKEWLDKKFNSNFPDVSFKISQLYDLDIKILADIANCIGIKYFKKRKTTVQEKLALCRAIKKFIY